MRLIIFGPQGAGKGTQSARLQEKFDIAVVSTGDMFREGVKSHSDLGAKVRSYIDAGKLVPDELTIEVVRARLSQDDARSGFLLDGFPRTIGQAKALDEVLADEKQHLDAAIALEVPEDVSLRRIMGRRVCKECGRNYHVDAPPASDWRCDRCGGEVVQRNDDADEEAIRSRLEAYHEQTEPLKEYYRDQGILREVN
ncbi:MAG TPA: adenylate kinase, partial [Actinomycetota bacterium]|nr:adenylate kinase [Actinomycetota bacterium]